MAVPKKKTSKSRRGKRRAHQSIQERNLVPCRQCKKLIPPHQVCPYCGTYQGRTVLDIEAKEKKKKKKKKERRQ